MCMCVCQSNNKTKPAQTRVYVCVRACASVCGVGGGGLRGSRRMTSAVLPSAHNMLILANNQW